MRAGPRAASASPSPDGRRPVSSLVPAGAVVSGVRAASRFPASMRIRQSSRFLSLARDRSALQIARGRLALSAATPGTAQASPSGAAESAAQSAAESAPQSAPQPTVRFGFTVAKRQAARAVARNAVKRVLREAARTSGWMPGPGVDVIVRLRSPLPRPAERGWRAMKRDLRLEADALLRDARQRLLAGPPRRGPVRRREGEPA